MWKKDMKIHMVQILHCCSNTECLSTLWSYLSIYLLAYKEFFNQNYFIYFMYVAFCYTKWDIASHYKYMKATYFLNGTH